LTLSRAAASRTLGDAMTTSRLQRLLLGLVGPASPGFRRLWLATTVSVLGTWAAVIALAVRTYDETGSAAWVSALFVAEFAPPIAIGIFLGRALDRLGVRRGLVASDLLNAAVFATLAFVHEPVAVVALALVGGAANGVFRPLSVAAVPLVVPDEELDVANGALAGIENGMTFLAQAIGGIAVALVGAAGVLGVNALTFVASALLLATCRPLRAGAAAAGPGPMVRRGLLGDLRVAAATIRRSTPLLHVAVPWTLLVLLAGAANGIEVAFLRSAFGAGPAAIGAVIACMSLGLVAGSVAGGAVVRRVGASFPLVTLLFAAGWLACWAAPSAIAAGAAFAALGVLNGLVVVHNRSALMRESAPGERGALIAFVMAVGSAAVVAGAALGGVVATVWDPRAVFLVTAVAAAALAAPAAALIHSRDGLAARPLRAADEPA
jgi:MFS family permease